MTMDTEKLIERLAEVVEPLRPLPRPWIRTAAWLLVAIPYIALVVFVVSPRGDLISKALEWRYVIEQLAALATGITAATAAFATVIPGHDRKFLFLPVLPLAIWLGSLGDGCVKTGYTLVLMAYRCSQIGSASLRSFSSAQCQQSLWPLCSAAAHLLPRT